MAAWEEYRRTRVKTKASRKAQAARRRGAKTAEVIKPDEIFQRDRVKCQLCGRRLNMKADYPHPDYPTLDHILPIAVGGLHTRANLQAAHLDCNTQKGAGLLSGSEHLRLVG